MESINLEFIIASSGIGVIWAVTNWFLVSSYIRLTLEQVGRVDMTDHTKLIGQSDEKEGFMEGEFSKDEEGRVLLDRIQTCGEIIHEVRLGILICDREQLLSSSQSTLT